MKESIILQHIEEILKREGLKYEYERCLKRFNNLKKIYDKIEILYVYERLEFLYFINKYLGKRFFNKIVFISSYELINNAAISLGVSKNQIKKQYELQKGEVALKFKSKTLPLPTVFIQYDDKIIKLEYKTYKGIFIEICKFLIDNNKITKNNCPIRSITRNIFLINSSPENVKWPVSYAPPTQHDKLFINSLGSAGEMLLNSAFLLKQFGTGAKLIIKNFEQHQKTWKQKYINRLLDYNIEIK